MNNGDDILDILEDIMNNYSKDGYNNKEDRKKQLKDKEGLYFLDDNNFFYGYRENLYIKSIDLDDFIFDIREIGADTI